MSIIEKTNNLREAIKAHGNHKEISRQSGVTFHWLCKFVTGEIKNPTVNNIAKIEDFFKDKPIQHTSEATD